MVAFSRLPLTTPFVVIEFEIRFDFWQSTTVTHPWSKTRALVLFSCSTAFHTQHLALNLIPGMVPSQPKPPRNLTHVDRPHSRSLLHLSFLIFIDPQPQSSQLYPWILANSGQMYFPSSVPSQPISRTSGVLHSPLDGDSSGHAFCPPVSQRACISLSTVPMFFVW
jgi:hypothetical protein